MAAWSEQWLAKNIIIRNRRKTTRLYLTEVWVIVSAIRPVLGRASAGLVVVELELRDLQVARRPVDAAPFTTQTAAVGDIILVEMLHLAALDVSTVRRVIEEHAQILRTLSVEAVGGGAAVDVEVG